MTYLESESKTKTQLVWWPSPQDYNESVQNPHVNVQNTELQSGLVYSDHLGLPRPITGGFASVYRLKCPQRDLALRCFLRNITDQEQRYAFISSFVQQDDLPYTVTFEFLPQGIKVAGRWFPALKMEWVDGDSLDHHILGCLGSPDKLGRLAGNFLKMMDDLRAAGVAHGDLQHGNIMIVDHGELRLVDYDGMYVPGMTSLTGNELGHRNFQHPQRQAEHFGPGMDNFSAWVIYTSIVALQADAKLWHQLAAGDDCLLFRQSDFLRPEGSPAFAALESHTDHNLRLLGRFLRSQLSGSPATVPHLQYPVPTVENLPPLASTASIRKGPRVISPFLPEWLRDDNVDVLKAHGDEQPAPQTTNHVPPPPVEWIDPRLAHRPANPQGTLQSGSRTGHQIEPELQQPRPRKVEYNPNSETPSPQTWQWLMLFNPLVWAWIYFFIQANGPDADLIRYGKDYTAAVTSISTYQYKSVEHLRIDYTYRVNGVDYSNEASGLSMDMKPRLEKEKTITVHALPTDPTFTEPIDGGVGSKQAQDNGLCFLVGFLSIACEILIWWTAWYHKSFAVDGVAVLAEVSGKSLETGPKGQQIYRVELKYTTPDKIPMMHKIYVSSAQYDTLKQGDVITILCDANDPRTLVVYNFCRYRATMTPTSPVTNP